MPAKQIFKSSIACFAILLLTLTPARAVEPIPEILLWPNGAPGSEGKTNLETVVRIADNGERVLSNIHKPSITPYLPAASMPGQASGRCAVIVAPGGGHRELWADHEGHNVARWLSDHGIAAFVLKYRLARETNSTYTVDDHAVADMQRALRLVRSHASEWGIATNRIGVMGFSAGGEVAFLTAQAGSAGRQINSLAPQNGERAGVRGNEIDPIDRLSALPNYQALIYPGRSNRIEPATNSPPVFMVCGYNDRQDISEGLANVYLGTHLQNQEWVRWLLAGRWQDATKEHSHRRSVTEEQRRQRPTNSQPAGLPIFGTAASVARRSKIQTDILPPRALPQPQISGNAPVPDFGDGF